MAAKGIDLTSARLDWPALVMARLPIPGARARTHSRSVLRSGRRGQGEVLRRRDAGSLWAQIELPKSARPAPDLIFISRHDWQPAFDACSHYVALDGVPHPIRPGDLAAERKDARRRLDLAPRDRMVAVLIGGENPAFRYSEAVRDRIADDLQALAANGAGFSSPGRA